MVERLAILNVPHPLQFMRGLRHPAQLLRRPEPTLLVEVLGRRDVHRSGDVPGHRVDRLDLPAIALGGARVDQHVDREHVADLDDRHPR